MGASEWQRLLGGPSMLGDLYGGRAPALDECELFYVHADERDNSVTVGFDTVRLPSHPRSEWSEAPYNRFEFYLFFSDVADFQVNGWSMREARDIHVATAPGGAISVSFGDTGAGIHFTAPSVRLARTRVYLASDVP
ncbi:Imm50 family immunity protein [Streptomyces sp. NPDC101171]|uniref:Imm50 family immunity protein n=1 Tax=Streptomyces sp. NPDC101171 TaxID=3366122 RepID=UPI003822DB9E